MGIDWYPHMAKGSFLGILARHVWMCRLREKYILAYKILNRE